MKHLKKFLIGTAVSQTVLTLVFYLFATLSKLTDPLMSVSKYFTLLLFGAAISLGTLVFDTKLNVFLKYAINYATLLASFCTVFLTADSGSDNEAARAFAGVFIFTVFYAFAILLCFIFKTTFKNAKRKRGKGK